MYSQQLKLKLSGTEMALQLRKSASSILSGGSSATPAVVATAELLMRAAISCGMDKMDGAASQRQGQCGTTRAAAKPARCLQSYAAGSRICPHKLLRSMRTRDGQPPTAPLATLSAVLARACYTSRGLQNGYSSLPPAALGLDIF